MDNNFRYAGEPPNYAAAEASASCRSKSREKPLMIPNSINFFSELEVNAIELLVQLSGSSCCNGGSTEEENDVKSRAAPPTFFAEDEDEDEVSFGPRKKGFRSISELYKLTEPVNLVIVAAKENKRKRKRSI